MSIGLELQDLVGALAHLPDEAQVTLTVRTSDLRAALERRAGGPSVVDTKQAAGIFGYSADQWKRWAGEGKIEGAWQDAEGAPWRLPRASCERHIERMQTKGRRGVRERKPRAPRAARAVAPASPSSSPTASQPTTPTTERSRTRGPRIAHQLASQEVGHAHRNAHRHAQRAASSAASAESYLGPGDTESVLRLTIVGGSLSREVERFEQGDQRDQRDDAEGAACASAE